MPTSTRPTIAEISLQALAYNLKGIRRKIGKSVKVMGVVKANAYGHGLTEVAKFLENQSIDYLGVANAEEGVALREAGLRSPIHVFTLPSKSQARLYGDFQLESTVCSEADARLLNADAERRRISLPVHLKIDTGMNRIGVKGAGLLKLLKALSKMRRLEIKGVYTHFATADQKDKTFSEQQLVQFREALDILRAEGVTSEHIHCAGSAAILDLPESYFSMVRPGIMLYGYYPSHQTSESVPIRPVLTLKSKVSLVKWIESGESVSYGRRFIAKRRTQIATLPLGYADGYMRLLTGKGEVLIGGRRFSVVGTICMDQIMVDAGSSDVSAGDEAVLIGRQGREKIDAWDLAERIGTIPYEICTNISSRVPRIYRDL
ncbi:MAG: alanine racemase [Bacteroidota bacterium]